MDKNNANDIEKSENSGMTDNAPIAERSADATAHPPEQDITTHALYDEEDARKANDEDASRYGEDLIITDANSDISDEDIDIDPENYKDFDEDDIGELAAEVYEEELENKFNYLTDLLDSRRYSDFRQELEDLNPVDAADFFAELAPKRIPTVFRLLRKDTAADVFAELDYDVQEKIVAAMTDRELSFIIEDLALDDAVDTVSELPANMVRRIMRNATPETRADINRFLAYPPDSAGSVMTAEYIDLRADMTCAQAIDHIRETGIDKETVYVAYVTDDARILTGSVALKDLLFAQPNEPIEEIMDPNIICASTLDDRETVASTISKYHMLALPIVDKEGRLVGLVTVDDAMDVLETEVTEDIEKMAAIVPSDKSYLKTGVFETWSKRIPWLLLLMVSATFTSTILSYFESALSTCAVLTLFIPMLMDTGGNAGGQTSVTIIRSLSLGEIEPRGVLRVLWKEIRVAMVCGLTLAVACFIKTMLIDFKLQFTTENIMISLIVCITIFAAILIAKSVGAMLPIGAKVLGLDPAVMASPFITTIVDAITLVVYFTIAAQVLKF